MANRPVKRCSVSLTTKKMPVNTKVRYNLTPVRMTIIIILKEITRIGEDVEKREQWYTIGRDVNSCTHYGK